MPKSNPLTRARSERDGIGAQVGVHGDIDGDIGNRLPGAEETQNDDAAGEPDDAAGQRDQHGLGEKLAKNQPAARAKGQAKSDFFGAVGGARGEQAAQVGAGGQKNNPARSIRPAMKARAGPPSMSPIRPGRARREFEAIVVARIGFGEPCADSVQIGRRLCRSDARS